MTVRRTPVHPAKGMGLSGVYLACAGLYALGSTAVLWLCRRTTTIRPG